MDHVLEQRSAGERMQHLGQVRAHARTLAGGEDHDIECGKGCGHHAGIKSQPHD
jgi:hypothetical protein